MAGSIFIPCEQPVSKAILQEILIAFSLESFELALKLGNEASGNFKLTVIE